MKKFTLKQAALFLTALIALFPMSSIGKTASAPESAVNFLLEKGILTGYEDGSIGGDKEITRAEFTSLVAKAFELPTEHGNTSFADVQTDFWGYDVIMRAKNAGIINGFEDGLFYPQNPVTYEQAVKMLVCLLGEGEYMLYPVDHITFAMENGLCDSVCGIIGENITRENVFTLLYNTLNFIQSDEFVNGDYIYPTSIRVLPETSQPTAPAELPQAEEGAILMTDFSPDADYNASVSGGGSGGGSSAHIAFSPTPGWDYNSMDDEEYTAEGENIFKDPSLSPLSTFSADVDTAAYSTMRRYILGGQLPPKSAVRSEELINYFDYTLPTPDDKVPFSVTSELHECPWNPSNKLLMLALRGADLNETEKQPSNLVFLIDTSGSMFQSNRLPLVQKSMSLMLEKLDASDTISIVTYAGSTSVALDPTPASEKEKILNVINNLRAAGSTAGSAGIELAYQAAEKSKIDGNNRIILCTDGDFNVGITDNSELENLIAEKRASGIYLTVLGFGMGNYKDNRMEMLADKGNGNYAYIDNLKEAKRVLVDNLPKTLYSIADDVKFQAEFNPQTVAQYRLIGYENRKLENEDFINDAKDAGEVGAGHTVVVLYEITPQTGDVQSALKYQNAGENKADLLTLKIRYKNPGESESQLVEKVISTINSDKESDNFKLASAAAEFSLLLRDSEFKSQASFENVITRTRSVASENDKFGINGEFVQLVDLANYIAKSDNYYVTGYYFD